VLLELLHVRSNQHLAQFDEVAVLLIINLDDTPWVATAADLSPICGGDLRIGANNSERNLRHNLIVLCNRFVVIKFVTGTFEYLNGMVLDIGKNLKQLVSI